MAYTTVYLQYNIYTVYIIKHTYCTKKHIIMYYFALTRFSIDQCKSAIACRTL